MTNRFDTCHESINQFKNLYGYYPQFVSIVPGRVNIIGEHIDHQSYSVLPIATNHSVQVAIGISCHRSMVTINHFNSKQFPSVSFNSIYDIFIHTDHSWFNYIVASLLGLIEFTTDPSTVGNQIPRHSPPKGNTLLTAQLLLATSGIQIFVNGNIPIAAGVSSSSALVVAATMAFSNLWNISLSPFQLADLCCLSERHVGTAGGGMDQACVVFSEKGKAKLIGFDPLSCDTVPLPPNISIVVCNTCVDSPKAVDASKCYNKRVFELKIGCYILMKHQFPNEQIKPDQISKLNLRIVQEMSKKSLTEMLELSKTVIPNIPISRSEIKDLIGNENLESLLKFVGVAVFDRNVSFDVLRRVLHVYNEAIRVHQFVSECKESSIDHQHQLKLLGRLLNDSNHSLNVYFDCGCPELLELTELACQSGAYGSRLTGAGWGGCCLSLVDSNKVNDFIDKMKSYYYRSDRLIPINLPANISDAIFVVAPDDGAEIYETSTGKPNKIDWVKCYNIGQSIKQL